MPESIQRVVITGGEGSLGQAIAAAMAGPASVVDAPGRGVLDVASPESVQAYFENRPVELLVCAAGITRDAPISRLSSDAWDETWNINFAGALRCARAVLPAMELRSAGHIIFISSQSAIHPPPGQAAYAAAKAALLGLATELARRHGPAGIRVNTVLPGFLETRMTAPVSAARKAEVLAGHVLGRFNTCEAVGRFIRFLHDELPHTSGQVFQLDNRPPPP